MSLVMFRRALRDQLWTILWYALGLVFYVVVLVALYPTTKAAVAEQAKAWPKAWLQAFGVSDVNAMATFTGFIGSELLNLIWPLIAAVFLIVAGTAAIALEVERGTVELWLSVPVGRTRLLSAKLAAIALGSVVLVLVTTLAIAVGAAMIHERLTVPGVLAASVSLLAFSIAVLGYSTLFSALSSTRGRAAALAAGVTFAFYLMWVVAGLIDVAWLTQILNHLSIFAAFHPSEVLATGAIPLLDTLALVAVGLTSVAAALVVFQRRDATA